MVNKNVKKDISKMISNSITVENKSLDSSKSRKKTKCSLISNHSVIFSKVSHCPKVASIELESTSDEDVVFQGVYKSNNFLTGSKEYTSDEISTASQKDTPFIPQSNEIENSGKSSKFCNAVLSNAEKDDLFSALVDNSVGNDKLQSGSSRELEEIFVEENFANKKFNLVDNSVGNNKPQCDSSRELEESFVENNSANKKFNSNFVLPKPSKVMKKSFDFVPEPVNFEVPVIHENESVLTPSEEDIRRWKKLGFSCKKGRWTTPKEDEILRRNYKEFSEEYGICDPVTIFGIYSDRKKDCSLSKFLRAKHFYLRLGKNLNDRNLASVYNRARTIFHPYTFNIAWSSEDILKLIDLYKTFGNKWNIISKALKKHSKHCQAYFYGSIIKSKIYGPMLENKP
ncbi:uncharacterized protein LOC129226134 [Uloborus diversus]|uniref:uncharacterized protein LOC129226134 n=1 Tax=Uloborus diversus TaxID=327109 RepID=UPI002409DC9C|nr:uncharacterized protein LOC129226134 [Uloborus diversus]